MTHGYNKSIVFWGTFWSALEAIGRHGISFLIGLVLARLLFPSDYGLIGELAIFLAISQVFIDCGFSNALICKHQNNEEDYSTAFLFNCIIGCISYIILFFAAPYVAEFYDEPILTFLLRIIGLNVIFNSLCVVQNAIFVIELKIKLQTKISVICQLSTGLLAIVAAYKGYGVWALALQSVSSSFLTTVLLWVYAKWRPSFVFSRQSFSYLWGFGSKMLFVGLISNIYKNLYGIIIGKVFDPTRLGLYNKAQNLADLYPKTIYSFTNKVSLPTLAALKSYPDELKEVFRKYLKVIGFVVFPVSGILFVTAHPLITVLWGDRWIDSIVLFQILCIGAIWDPFNLFSLNILQAIGRPDVTLKIELVNKIVGIILILTTLKYGLFVFVCGRAAYNIYEYLVNLNCTRVFIHYKIKEQVKDLLPSITTTAMTMILSWSCLHLGVSQIMNLIISVIVGITAYIAISFIFKLEGLVLIKDLLSVNKKNNVKG